MVADLPDRTSYLAFLKALRAVVDWRGQVVTLLDRCYLTQHIPTQIIWGAQDSVFPLSQAKMAHSAMPGSRLDVFDRAGHYPFHDDPIAFLRVIEHFLATTAAATFNRETWRQQLSDGVDNSAISGSPATRLAVLGALDSGGRTAT